MDGVGGQLVGGRHGLVRGPVVQPLLQIADYGGEFLALFVEVAVGVVCDFGGQLRQCVVLSHERPSLAFG